MELNELLRRHDKFKQRQGRAAKPPMPVQSQIKKPVSAKAAPVSQEPRITVKPTKPVQPVVQPDPEQPKPVQLTAEAAVQPEAVQPVAEAVAQPEAVQPVEEASVQPVPAEDIENTAIEDVSEQAASADADIADDFVQDADENDFDEDEDGNEERDPSPFASMTSIFRSVLGKFRRKNSDVEDDFDGNFDEDENIATDEDFNENGDFIEGGDFNEDEPLSDDEPIAEPEVDEAAVMPEEIPAAAEPSVSDIPVESVADTADVEDVEDIADIEDVSGLTFSAALSENADFIDEPAPADDFDDDLDDLFDEPAPTDDLDDDLFDDDAPAPKKKLNLFGWLKKKGDKSAAEEPALAFDDSDYAEDGYEAEQFPEEELEASDEEAAAAEDFEDDSIQDFEMPADAPALDVADVADFSAQEAFEDDEEFYDDEDYDDEEFDDEDEESEDDGRPQPSRLRRFLNLFIVREDDDADPSEPEGDGWDDDDGDSWKDDQWPEAEEDDSEYEPYDHYEDPQPAYFTNDWFVNSTGHEGGANMDDKNKIKTDVTDQLAASLESQGMSRRERRELAARLAAEEAARQAAQQPEPVAEPVQQAEPVAEPVQQAEPIVEANDFAEAPAVQEEPQAEMPSLFETLADTTDEPTRIFKPLTALRTAEEPAVETPAEPVAEEEAEDEEVEEEKPSRFSLFRKKAATLDDEDEDDEDDEEDDDEDDEEFEEEKPRRSLFGRKKKLVLDVDDDEDEDDDEFDDEEDEEEDDEDDFDDDDDDFDDDDEDDYDEDDEDDDNDHRPLGVRILGFFKWLCWFILVLVFAVFVLNILDYFSIFSLDNVFERYYNKAPGVFDTLFPSHNLKMLIPPTETIESIPPIDPTTVTAAPVEAAATETPVA